MADEYKFAAVLLLVEEEVVVEELFAEEVVVVELFAVELFAEGEEKVVVVNQRGLCSSLEEKEEEEKEKLFAVLLVG